MARNVPRGAKLDYLNLDTGAIWTIALFAGTFLINILGIGGVI